MARAVLLSSVAPIGLPARDLWSILADTERLNRAIELSPVQFAPVLNRRQKGHFTAEAHAYGRRVRYEEFPFEWVQDRFYQVLRRFERGPIDEIITGVRLHPTENGTDLEVFARIVPRTWLGTLVARTVLTRKATRATIALVRAYEQHERDPESHPEPALPPPDRLNPTQLSRRIARLATAPVAQSLIDRLASHVRTAPDLDVLGMRPFDLADRWGVDRMQLLPAFLHAANSGVVDLNWSVLCPVCRTAREQPRRLQDVTGTVHCDTCEIAFDADLASSVEVRFDVNPAIRRAQQAHYCIGGPKNTPSVIAQLRVESGEHRSEQLDVDPGWLRVRCYQVGTPLSCDATDSAGTRLRVQCGPGELLAQASPGMNGAIQLDVTNLLPDEALVVVERESWKDGAATAALVTSLQGFKDLFPDQGVAPGDQIGIANLAVLFTDLGGSTAMYERLGDVKAFAFVQSHFHYLRAAVLGHRGSVVKKMGDAVMATFADATLAWSAAAAMEAGWNDFCGKHLSEDGTVSLKIGLHQGPAVMIDNDDRVDYFGATVNLAARVQGCSEGGDIVISRAVYDDPDVATLLSMSDFECEKFTVSLKGIHDEQSLYRLRRAAR